jgi:hypothetical protein
MKRRHVPRSSAGQRNLPWWPCLLGVLAVVTTMAGCTRCFYRKCADEEVEGILAEKDKFPLWKIEQFHVYPDERARFADPSCADKPPMPPDDEAAFCVSPHPQAPYKAGVARVGGTAWLEMIQGWDQINREKRKRLLEEEREDGEGKDRPEKLPVPQEAPPVNPDHPIKLPPRDGQHLQPVSAVTVRPQKGDEPGGAGPTPAAAGPTPAGSAERHPVATYFDEFVTAQPPGFLLNLEQSVELGVINSPQYQTFREALYQAALPVTQARYNFAYQWAASEDFIREWGGSLAGPFAAPIQTPNAGSLASSNVSPFAGGSSLGLGSGSSGGGTGTGGGPGISIPGGGVNNWTGLTSVSFSKLFSTGALLTFDFLNTNTWNLLDPKPFTSVSTINLSAVQPFLQGGGRALTLEPLTQAERTLFYAIRAYARFREQFYANVALGSNLPGTLANAVIVSSAGNPISTLAALGIASTDVSGGFVSYLSTLFRECDLAADQKLVADLQKALRIYEGFQEGGQFSPLQVDQVRSTLLTAQNTVLTDRQFVNNAVDQFKLLLGLPANLPLILDDAPARPITLQLDRYYAVIVDADAANKRLEQQEELAAEKLRGVLMEIFTKERVTRGTELARKVAADWPAWAKATDKDVQARLDKLREERRTLLDRKTDLEVKGQKLSDKDAQRLRQSEIEADIGALEQILRRYEAKPWEKLAREEARRVDRIKLFRLVAYSAEIVLVWARNERFDAVGKRWPDLSRAPLCELDLSTAEAQRAQDEAVKFALAHRWDLMNERAQVVDAWRQLRVTANGLLGVFNVQYNLQSSTPQNGSHPFAFSTDRTSQALTFNTQLPLNRLPQRNAYRTALINYQQARRSLMTLEDNIAVQVRFDVRQLQLFAANYKIQKLTIASLYAQVESALELITAPADPSALQATGTTGQANAAALTNQYLTALSSLNNAQTRMYDIWLSYLATRIQLYLDLESLKMDEHGVWIEPGTLELGGIEACQPGARPAGEVTKPVTDAEKQAQVLPSAPVLSVADLLAAPR